MVATDVLPTTVRESVRAWRAGFDLPASERALLELSLSLDDSDSTRPRARLFDVPIQLDGRTVKMHTIELLASSSVDDRKEAIVLLPGFGASLGFFDQVLAGLHAYTSRYRVFAIDWPGTGRSSMVAEPHGRRGKAQHAQEIEDWFADSLEQWRIEMQLDRLVLVAHSLGGSVTPNRSKPDNRSYHAIAYALRYGTVKGMVLVSPAGLTSRESPIAFDGQRFVPPDGPPRTVQEKGLAFDLVHALWHATGLTPAHLLRWSLVKPIAPLLVSKFVKARFENDEARMVARYHYAYATIAQGAGSSLSISGLLNARGAPILPLLPRMQPLVDRPIPLAFLRGSLDWLPTLNTEVAQRMGATYRELPDVGHCPHLEAPAQFMIALHSELARFM